jgi:foldase protein PrsA
MIDSPLARLRRALERRWPVALGAVAGTAVAIVAIGGCGNEVPPNGVAKVGDTVITKSEFDRWLQTAATGQQQQAQGGGSVVAPDPPDFERCVAARQKQPAPEGATKPTTGQLKQQCKQEYDTLKDQVMQFLIQAQWVQQEAETRDVRVTDAEVTKQFEDQKKASFPNDKAYQEFLKSSGMTERDILFRVKLDTLQNKLRQDVIEGKGEVSNEEIEDYYNENKRRFAQPERRDLAVVLTKTEAKAKQAKEALDDGGNFRRVARRFSIDEASKSQGGKLLDVAKGQQEKALDEAVFGAKKGELVGPVRTQFGWYVFEVQKVKPASQQSLQEARETIRNLLRSQSEQKALEDFIDDFRDKYKDETACRDGFVVAECENAPKEKTDTGPASGGQPAPGGAPQGQPGAPPEQPGVPPGQPGAPQGQPGAPPVPQAPQAPPPGG